MFSVLSFYCKKKLYGLYKLHINAIKFYSIEEKNMTAYARYTHATTLLMLVELVSLVWKLTEREHQLGKILEIHLLNTCLLLLIVKQKEISFIVITSVCYNVENFPQGSEIWIWHFLQKVYTNIIFTTQYYLLVKKFIFIYFYCFCDKIDKSVDLTLMSMASLYLLWSSRVFLLEKSFLQKKILLLQSFL